MGGYNEIFAAEAQSQEILSSEEGIIGIVTVSVFADGQPSDEESQVATDIVNSLDIFEDYSPHQIQKMFDKAAAILQKEGIGSLFNTSVAAISEDLGEIAFAIAAEIVLADNTVYDAEDIFLSNLADALHLSSETAQKIIDEVLDV